MGMSYQPVKRQLVLKGTETLEDFIRKMDTVLDEEQTVPGKSNYDPALKSGLYELEYLLREEYDYEAYFKEKKLLSLAEELLGNVLNGYDYRSPNTEIRANQNGGGTLIGTAVWFG